jgi:hypothetical protein
MHYRRYDMTPATEVAARWCYAELCSTRFRESYLEQHLVPIALADKAMLDISFSDLDSDERECLRVALSKHNDRGPIFYRMLIEFPHYIREEWTYKELCQIIMVPYYNCHQFEQFAANPPPRLKDVLATIPKGPFRQKEPVIVIPYKGQKMLLEGTLRSLWFARDRSESDTLAVWVPEPAGRRSA